MIKQNTPEWLEMRKKHLGASDAPVVMGVSPWKSPFQLWEEKLGLRKSQFTSAAMQRGHDLEPKALEMYNNCTSQCAVPEVVFHPEKKWMLASLDGISLDRSMVVEIKCPGKEDHYLASTGKIPEKYYPQLQHQLAVIGLDLLHYFSYREDSFHLVEVERDEEYIQKLYAEEGAFWKNVMDFEPPSLCDRDYIRKEDLDWQNIAKDWVAVKKELEDIKQKEKECRVRLIELTNGQSCQGGGIRVRKIVRKGAINYPEIPELSGVDLEKYRKASIETWKLMPT